MNSMLFWLAPFTFSTFIFTSSIFIVLLSYILPSIKHSYNHLSSLQAGPVLVYCAFLFFFLLLSSSIAALFFSFKHSSNSFSNVSTFNVSSHKRRVTLALTLLIILQILVVTLSIIGFCKLFISDSKSKTSTNLEEIGLVIEERLQWALKPDFFKDLKSLIDTFVNLTGRLEIPKVHVDLDELLQKVLTDNAFYQASTAIRVLKFLMIYFGILLNGLIFGTIYWTMEYRSQLLKMFVNIEGSFDHRDLYEDRVVASNYQEPSSEEAELRALNYHIHKGQNSVNYCFTGGSPMTEITPMTSPENNAVRTPDFSSKGGIIEIPFIGKSQESLNSRKPQNKKHSHQTQTLN